jgi:hypothetical protein
LEATLHRRGKAEGIAARRRTTPARQDGSRAARREHHPRARADEQRDGDRREGAKRLPQRDLARAPAGRRPVQDGPRHADQHQAHRQPRGARRRDEQAPHHAAGWVQIALLGLFFISGESRALLILPVVVVVGRLYGALQHVGSWEAFLHSQEGKAQRGHVRWSARSALPVAYFVPNANGRCSVSVLHVTDILIAQEAPALSKF